MTVNMYIRTCISLKRLFTLKCTIDPFRCFFRYIPPSPLLICCAFSFITLIGHYEMSTVKTPRATTFTYQWHRQEGNTKIAGTAHTVDLLHIHTTSPVVKTKIRAKNMTNGSCGFQDHSRSNIMVLLACFRARVPRINGSIAIYILFHGKTRLPVLSTSISCCIIITVGMYQIFNNTSIILRGVLPLLDS